MAKPASRPLPRPLFAFLGVSVALFVLDRIYSHSGIWPAPVQGLMWPFREQPNLFWDYTIFADRMRLYHTAQFFVPRKPDTFYYPATMAVLLHWMYKLSFNMQIVPNLVAATIAASATGFAGAMIRRGVVWWQACSIVLIAALCSFPFLLEYNTANLEIFVCILTMLAIWCMRKERDMAAAVLIGAAASLKVYPILFCAIFVSQRKYRQAGTAIATAAVLWFGSIALLGPTFLEALRGTNHGLRSFVEDYAKVWRVGEVGFDHSIVALIKTIGAHTRPMAEPMHWVELYLPVAAVATVLIYVVRLRKLPAANQIAVVSILMVILPPVSYDYTLINLYSAFAVVMLLYTGRDAGERDPQPGKLLGAGFGVVFSQCLFIERRGILMSGAFRCVVLLAMVFVALRWPLPDGNSTIEIPIDSTAPQEALA